MRVAIFSDVHANLPALEAFVDHTRREVDTYVCLGDVVNYGPWNDECLDVVFGLPGIVMLEGNHERLFVGADPIEHEILLVRKFFAASIRSFNKTNLIRDLPREHRLGNFICTHTVRNERIYQDTKIEIDQDYMIGHTHHAFDVHRGIHRIVNCGSIGQNRRRLNVLSYAIYDTTCGGVTLCQHEYRVDRLFDEMIACGYPQECLNYYQAKVPRVRSI